MAEIRGVIRNISTMRAMLDLYIYDDGIVVARGSLRSAVRRGAEAGAFRGAGRLLAGAVADEGPAGLAMSRDQLIAADAANRWLPFASTSAIRLHRAWFGNGRLELIQVDGTTDRFEWKRVYNEFADVERLLRATLGERLEIV